MNLRIHNYLPLVVVLILALLTLWLRQAAELAPEGASSADSKQPDAIADNLSIVRLGSNGKPQYSMSAKRLLHYTRDNVSMLESPRFDKRDADGVQTVITANRGRISMNSEEAFFYGDVRMTRTGAQRELKASTEYLHVIPSQNVIRSDQQVTIDNGGARLSGVGLEINKASGQISLQSQIKGTYHVTRKQ